MKFLVSIIFLAYALQPKQGSHKVFAYVQNISGGAHRIVTDNSGNIIEEGPSLRKEYFIYLEIKKGNLKVDSIKIDNSIYTVALEKTQTPALKSIQTLMNTKEKKLTLVPRSINSVYRIYPQNKISTVTDKRILKSPAPIIIYYKIDKSPFTKTIDKIIMLPEEIRP